MTTKVLVCGNSTATGFVGSPLVGGEGHYTTDTPAAVAASILNARSGFGEAVFDNVAVGGTMLAQWLDGHTTAGGVVIPPLATRLATSDATVVLGCFGINEAFTPGITVENYMSQVQNFRNIVLAAHKTPIFVTDNPISYSTAHNNILWGLMNGVRVVAAQMGMQVVDCNDAISRHVDNWQQFLPDKIHGDETLKHFAGTLIATSLARHII